MMKYLMYSVLFTVLLLSGCARDPMPEAFDSLHGAVETEDYYWFAAAEPTTDVCYVYFPGGLVYAEAYAPYMEALAARGVNGFLLRPVMTMALWDVGLAEKAKNSDYSKQHCKQFVIGGHSLGGLAVIEHAIDNPEDGLLFLSAYIHKPDIINHSKPVMLLHGEHDLLTTIEEYAENEANVPAHAEDRVILGGNHGQMGHYGLQEGDGEATISREEQQAQLIQATLDIIAQMENNQ